MGTLPRRCVCLEGSALNLSSHFKRKLETVYPLCIQNASNELGGI